MGYYINQKQDGTPLSPNYDVRLQQLKNDGAIIATGREFVPNLCCLVDNGPFSALGFAYDQNELDAFNDDCGRRKTFLVIPNADKLSGYL